MQQTQSQLGRFSDPSALPSHKPTLPSFLEHLRTDPLHSRFLQWNPAGTAFRFIDVSALQAEVFPQYFSCKWESFRTYLWRYGFESEGEGWWSHPSFTREGARVQEIRLRRGGARMSEDPFPMHEEPTPEPLHPPSAALPPISASHPAQSPARPSAFYRITGFLSGTQWVNLFPEDEFVYRFQGLWCTVATEADVKLAQHSSSTTYVNRCGRLVALPPGVLLRYAIESGRYQLDTGVRPGTLCGPAVRGVGGYVHRVSSPIQEVPSIASILKTAYPEPPQANSYFVNFLHDLLSDPSYTHVIEWNSAGTMFRINNWDILREQIFPRYFQCKWTSFMKYFVFYEFKRQGGYMFRKYFTRDDAQLDKIKKRPKKPKPKEQGWTQKPKHSFPSLDSKTDPARDSTNTEFLKREPALPPPALQPLSTPPGDPIVGYTYEGQYHPLGAKEKACFFLDGRFVQADTANLHIYERHPSSRPCLFDGSKHLLINGAQFHAVDPRPQTQAVFRVLGYLQDGAWVHLMPEDLVVYWYQGLWCSVLTQTDVKLAQHTEARVYVVHEGEYFMLEPGTLLYVRQETEQLEPTVIAREKDQEGNNPGSEGEVGAWPRGGDCCMCCRLHSRPANLWTLYELMGWVCLAEHRESLALDCIS